MNRIRYILVLSILVLINKNAVGQDSLLNIITKELKREYETIKAEKPQLYYIDYRVDDLSSYMISTSFGSLTNNNVKNGRILTTTVRVGSYEYDNSHIAEGMYESPFQVFPARLPEETQSPAIEQAIWQATQIAYRYAVDNLTQVSSSVKVKKEESKVADFSKEKAVSYYEAPQNKELKDKEKWIERLKAYSGLFVKNQSIISADAGLSYVINRKYLVSTEGTSIVQNESYAQIHIIASAKAEDGQLIPLYKSYYAFTPENLPSDEQVMRDLEDMKNMLTQLQKAPLAEPYTGPAILSPSASAVFFHEIFGHRIEGHRMKSNSDSQTFKTKVGDRLLPKYMNIVCDPTVVRLYNQDMFGYYKYDDQGVAARKVQVIENGILRNFIMSRTPIEGFENSNGHGRSQAGLKPVARQSNLIVETSKPISNKELRKKLITECKKQNKAYGYFFDQVTGGFTLTSRYTPNVFNVEPTVVYRIYVDGRPDELVRGVDFIGTPLAIFSEVEATGDSTGIFTGYCGAESGSIPVTAVAPELYIKKIETQKKPENFITSPILSRPDIE